MQNLKILITYSDFLSSPSHLTINERGGTRKKTFYGGILSIIYVIVSFCFTTYFILRLLLREDVSVMYSREMENLNGITNSNKLPFMVRLSDYYRKAINPENIFNITMKICYSLPNRNIGENTIEIFENIILEKCDINKHFGEYKNYFINMSSLDTYFCPRERLSNQTIFGIYGDFNDFSLYNFYFTLCSKKENNNCYYPETIHEKLVNAFLDLIYIDYSIDNLNKESIKQLVIKSERFMISSSIYKKIYLYLKKVKYISDYGLILSDLKEEDFHQFDSLRFYTDLRDINNLVYSDEKGTFLTLSIGNSGEVSVYHRRYFKLQDYLANISGIIKCFTLIFKILNTNNSKNTFYKKLIKDFFIENKSQINGKNVTTQTSIINNSENFLLKNINKRSPVQEHKIIYANNTKLKEKENIDKKFRFTILPLGFAIKKKEDLEIIKWIIKTINNKMNLIEILKKLEMVEKIKNELCNIQCSPKALFLKNINLKEGVINTKLNNNYISSDNIQSKVFENKFDYQKENV